MEIDSILPNPVHTNAHLVRHIGENAFHNFIITIITRMEAIIGTLVIHNHMKHKTQLCHHTASPLHVRHHTSLVTHPNTPYI